MLSLNDLLLKLWSEQMSLMKCDPVQQPKQFLSLMQKFKVFVGETQDENLCDAFFQSSHCHSLKLFFREYNDRYVKFMEQVEVLKLLDKLEKGKSCFVDLIESKQVTPSYQAIDKELTILPKSSKGNVVFIGCGAFPKTLLYIHEHTDFHKIIGIDCDKEAVYRAKELITALELKNMEVLCLDGKDYDYQEADIVHIALFVPEKEKILQQIAATARIGVRILVRLPLFFSKLLYDGLSVDLPESLQLVDRCVADSNMKREVVVLEKVLSKSRNLL